MDSEPTCSAIIFSDSVIREHGTGKLSFIGSFQGFNVPGFPFVTPRFFITVFISNLRPTTKELNVTVDLRQVKAGVVASCNAHLGSLENASGFNPKMVVEIPIPFPSVQFPAKGEYEVEVRVDGEIVGHRPIFVNQITAPGS